MDLIQVAGHCNDELTCPKMFVKDDSLVVQAPRVTDDEVRERLRLPAHEDAVEYPLAELPPEVAAYFRKQAEQASAVMRPSLTADEFFQRVRRSTFRLETFSVYAGDPDGALRVFVDEGRVLPLSERPTKQKWMRRIADTVAAGKQVARVHVLEEPLTTYLRYELATYAENVEAGEEVRIADRAAASELAELAEDFWLCDAETDRPWALLMRYDADGRFVGDELTEDPAVIDRCRRQRDLALRHSVTLAEYLSDPRNRQAG
jgi:hypothetical protein